MSTTVVANRGGRPRPRKSLPASIKRFRAEARRLLAAERRTGVWLGSHPAYCADAQLIAYVCTDQYEPTRQGDAP